MVIHGLNVLITIRTIQLMVMFHPHALGITFGEPGSLEMVTRAGFSLPPKQNQWIFSGSGNRW